MEIGETISHSHRRFLFSLRIRRLKPDSKKDLFVSAFEPTDTVDANSS